MAIASRQPVVEVGIEYVRLNKIPSSLPVAPGGAIWPTEEQRAAAAREVLRLGPDDELPDWARRRALWSCYDRHLVIEL